MPATYIIDPFLKTVFSKAWGVLLDEELLACQQALGRDPVFDPDLNQLFLFTNLSDIRIETGNVEILAAEDPFGARSKRALVVDCGEMLISGLLRMLESLKINDPDELRVQFDRLEEACDWLGLKTDQLPAGWTGI